MSENKFIRRIGKSILHYENGEISLHTTIKKTKPIVPKKLKELKLNTRFITMDLETVSINNAHVPYLLCWFDGKNNKSYFLTPRSANEIKDLTILSKADLDKYILDMVLQAMKDICKRKYKGYRIYLHNFSKFDGYFLIKYLAQLGKCKPIIHKGRIISCKFKLFESKYSVTFMDSYLLLPNSLKELSNTFSVESPKSFFPVLFNDTNYIGKVPDYKYFSNTTLLEYNNYKIEFNDKIWNFREEATKYCSIDCISLYQVLNKFSKLIFDNFKLNITKFMTLPSLAFNLYTSDFLKKDSIHSLSGDIANNIRKGYTGGSVDMYKPISPRRKKIYAYDVNSLYPYVMKAFKFTIGSPTYFIGDIRKIIDKPFGFFHCKITAPVGLLHPILQTHVKTDEGMRTIAPVGNWEGMFFSEELYNAEKFGYKFEILWGYTFESDYLFKSYVDTIYKIRLKYPKSDPMNLICKLFLNCIHGKLGMKPLHNIISILNKAEYSKFEDTNIDSILDVIDLDNSYLVQHKNPQVELDTALDNGTETHNVNISIAAAVTAYARIHMSQYKNKVALPQLYYSDTDSAYFDGPLPSHLVNDTELGKMRLEGIYDKAIFVGPKFYALKNNKEEIIKIRGLTRESIIKSNISIDGLETLLTKDNNIKVNQNK